MKPGNVTRQRLTDYLLGRLSAEEQDGLAAQYFVDNDLFAQLEEVEDELLDQYARGQMTAADRLQFESYLKRHPEGRHKVAVAQAFTTVLAEERAATTSQATIAPLAPTEPEQLGWRQMLLGWLAQPLPAITLAVGLVLLIGVLTWLLLLNRHLAQENQQLLAQARQQQTQQETLQQSVQDLQQTIAAQEGRTQQLQAELQREKQEREAQRQTLPPAGSAMLTTWMLTSPALRDPFSPPETVRLSGKVKNVELKLALREQKTYTGYHVVLQTLDGKQRLWEENLPQTPPPQTGTVITLLRPASQFAETSYKLTLTLKAAGGAETKNDYYFTVVK